jgi:hypothetical protein
MNDMSEIKVDIRHHAQITSPQRYGLKLMVHVDQQAL